MCGKKSIFCVSLPLNYNLKKKSEKVIILFKRTQCRVNSGNGNACKTIFSLCNWIQPDKLQNMHLKWTREGRNSVKVGAEMKKMCETFSAFLSTHQKKKPTNDESEKIGGRI